MENKKNTPETAKGENKVDKKLSLPVIIGAAVGAVAVVAIVLTLILGGGKDKGNNSTGGDGEGTSDVGGSGDGEVEGGILNEDNIDPDGWTKVDK